MVDSMTAAPDAANQENARNTLFPVQYGAQRSTR